MKRIEDLNEIRLTQLGESYYDGTGAYQKECDELIENMNTSKTLHHELFQGAIHVCYEYYFNGNVNAVDVVWSGDEDSREIENVWLKNWYGAYFFLVEKTLESVIFPTEVFKVVDDVKTLIEDSPYIRDEEKNLFSEENKNKYDRLVDIVIWYILNTEDEAIPEYYGN